MATNKKFFKCVLIGCGRIAPFHVAAIEKVTGMKLAAVCDVNREKATAIAEREGVPYYLDYKQMVTEIRPDIVHICTPSYLHLPMAVDVAKNGCHVVCEKPMGLNKHEAEAINRACTEDGVKLCCCFQNRFNLPVEKLKKRIGKMGKVYQVSLVVRWARDQKYYDDWHGKTKLAGGGALITQAIHHVDLLQYLFGMPEGVFAYKDRLRFNVETEDIMVAVLRFECGIKATLEVSTVVYPYNLESSITVLAEKETVKIGGLSMDKVEYWYTPEGTSGDRIKIDPSQSVYGTSHSRLFNNFVKSIIEDNKPLVSGDEGVKTAKIIDALYESSERGREIVIQR